VAGAVSPGTARRLLGIGLAEPTATDVAEGGGPWGDDEPPRDGTIRYVGDYELQAVLGRGGMGIVYRARQISLNRPVALKLIRGGRGAGDEELRRFRLEAEAVASLDHPGIVPIYEIGRHEGRDYFSMKLVSGESLDRLAGDYLGDPRAAAALVAEAAAAVHHAHQRGILHRDLKPGNILVDAEGRPHVTDFGLAKRLVEGLDADPTLTGTVLGTPSFMAPEQVSGRRGSVTTATDVYGLGAVLYALLTGRAPHRAATPLEMLEAVRDRAPEPPSSIDRRVPRTLQSICLKCLEKDPRRRYASAQALADDLASWLAGRPVQARPVGPLGRLRMWCRRNPVPAGLAAALTVTLAVGLVGAAASWREAVRQRDRLARANAQYVREWDTTRALNDFLAEDLIARSSPLISPRRDVTVGELLDRAAESVRRRFVGRPKLEASIRQVLADAYRSLGRLPQADAQLAECLRIRKALPPGDELDRLAAHHSLASLRLEQGRLDEATAEATLAFEGRRARLGESSAATLDSANLLVAALKAGGDVEGALALARRACEASLQELGPDHRTSLASLANLAALAYERGDHARAEAILRPLREARTRLFGADHPDTIFASSNLGAVLLARGDVDGAEAVLAEASSSADRVLGESHPLARAVVSNLAAAQAAGGRDIPPAQPGADAMRDATNRGVGLIRAGRADEASEILRGVLDRARRELRPSDPRLGLALINLAGALREGGKAGEAEPLASEAVALYRAALPKDDPRTLQALMVHGTILLDLGRHEAAESAAGVVVSARSRNPRGEPWRLAAAKSLQGAAMAGRGEVDRAEVLLREGLEGLEADPKAPPERLAEARRRLDVLRRERDRPAPDASATR
jgi:tetratricopeptide (TPR) repeat protein